MDGYFALTAFSIVNKKGNFSRSPVAVGTVGPDVLGTACERWGPFLPFRCVSFTDRLTKFSGRRMVQPRFELASFRRPSTPSASQGVHLIHVWMHKHASAVLTSSVNHIVSSKCAGGTE